MAGTRDMERRFAERRGITFRQRVAALVRKVVPEKMRDMFDGFRPAEKPPEPEISAGMARKMAVERHARAVTTIFALQDEGMEATPKQLRELQSARGELDGLRENASKDMEAAYKRDPSLAEEAASGKPERARDAMIREAEIRTNPHLRADRFVERWQQLDDRQHELYRSGRYSASQGLPPCHGRYGQGAGARSADGIDPAQPQTRTGDQCGVDAVSR